MKAFTYKFKLLYLENKCDIINHLFSTYLLFKD